MQESIPSIDKKGMSLIEENLSEIRNGIHTLTNGMTAIKHEVELLKKSHNLSAERVNTKLDMMLVRLNNLGLIVKKITPPGIVSTYKIMNPEVIDTTPQDMTETIRAALSEAQEEVDKRCEGFGEKILEITEGRDSIQCLADYVALMKSLRDEVVSRRNRVEALKKRRKNADKGSNEQKNAAALIIKIKSMIEPLERFSGFILRSFFKKRKRIMAEVWRTTVAVEELYDTKSPEFKERIPAESSESPIASALKELSAISHRHVETHRANMLVRTGDMSVLERRKILATLGKSEPNTK